MNAYARPTIAARWITGIAALSLLYFAGRAPAATLYFGDAAPPVGDFELTSGALGGPNYYDDAADAGGATPAAADTLHLGNNATITNGSGDIVTVVSLRVGVAPGNTPTGPGVTYTQRTGTLNITGGAVSTTDSGNLSFSIGDGRTGEVNASGDAVVTVSGRTQVGVAGPAGLGTGTLNIGGTAVWTSNGATGFAVGGQVMIGHLTLADNAQVLVPNGPFDIGLNNADGNSVTVNGGTLTVGGGWIFMGAGASTGNTFNQNGGTVNASGVTGAFNESLVIGHNAASEVSYALNSGALNVAGTAQIGNSGTGRFTAAGGTATFDEINVANLASGTGVFEVIGDDATIVVANRFSVSVGDDSIPAATGGLGTLRFETDALGNLSLTNVGGAAILGPATTVELDLAGSSPKPFYDLLAANSIDADLNAISFAGPVGYSLRITSGLQGEILQAVIPEPATAALGLISVFAMLPLMRRR
jgi:hypothetical protein